MDVYVRSLERANERQLSQALLGIPRGVLDDCRAVVDLGDFVLREDDLAHVANVQPLVRRVAHGAVVEVEAVDVDVGLHCAREPNQVRAI